LNIDELFNYLSIWISDGGELLFFSKKSALNWIRVL